MALGSGRFRNVLVLLSLIAVRGRASADPVEVESLIRQGVDLRSEGRDERALPFFQKAFALAPTPRTAGQLGLAEMATGYWLDAEQHLGTALESPDHPWVEKHRQVLRESLTTVQGHIGEIIVDGTPVGAAVTIDRRSVGKLPLQGPVRAVGGKVSVEISAPGYTSVTRSVSLAGGGKERLTVTLEASAPSKAAVAPPSVVAPSTPAASPVSAQPPVSGDASVQGDDGKLRRRLGWGAGIGAVAALGFAVVETAIWQNKRGKFNDPANRCFEDAPMRGAAGCGDFFDSAHSAQTGAIVGYAVAGALGVTSGVLLLTGQQQESAGSRVACAPGVGTSLVSCRFVF